MASSYSIAHVTPYPWEAQDNEVNAHVLSVSTELSRRGHRVLVLAPSHSQERVRESRKALRAARSNPQALLEASDGGTPRLIAVGEVLDVSAGARRRAPSLSIDVARTIEELLGTVELDFVHVHEPFAPSTSNAALRHSRALNVGSFHSSYRAPAVDAGRAALRGELLRTPGRAHGQHRGDGRADAAPLPGRLPADRRQRLGRRALRADLQRAGRAAPRRARATPS